MRPDYHRGQHEKANKRRCRHRAGRAVFAFEAAAPQGRIDFDNGGTPGRNAPAVERPEMRTVTYPSADKAQTRKAGVG